MKIIFSKNGIKREIETPFSICVSAADLDVFIQELTRMRAYQGNSTYGWLRIDPSHPSDCQPNTAVLKWTDARNCNPPSEGLE
jgi:hypothetical protein